MSLGLMRLMRLRLGLGARGWHHGAKGTVACAQREKCGGRGWDVRACMAADAAVR